MKRSLTFILMFALCGCSGPSGSGPATTNTTSDSFTSLPEKVEFLERYLTISRIYVALDFHIEYHNNSGGWVPGPSDCYIRLVANVPADQIDSWIPEGAKRETKPPDLQWLETVPGGKTAVTIEEWYVVGRTCVGIDRRRNLIAYRVNRY